MSTSIVQFTEVVQVPPTKTGADLNPSVKDRHRPTIPPGGALYTTGAMGLEDIAGINSIAKINATSPKQYKPLE